jgi:RNA polymerase sigma factor (sigma-70 family)
MASTEAAVGRDLRRLFDGGAVAGLTDAQLLDRVARRGGMAEEAFEAILTRHGPAVLACCRRVLGDSAAAEDAFQATFLVLFRRAGSIRVEGSLAPWLLHVARLAALKAREGELRRRAREGRAARPEALTPEEDQSDLHLLVRTEVDRLPGKYRDPVRLCYFEGRTHDDAAAALGWPIGTVRGRLSRAREMLRTRLERRGIGVAPTAVAAALAAGREARADVPQALREATLAATARGTAAKAGVATLAAAVARGLALATAMKSAAAVLAVVSLISAGAGLVVMAGRNHPPRPQPASHQEKGTSRAGTPAVDRYGDPLPKGAIARLGSIRFRNHPRSAMLGGRAFLTPDGKTLVTVGSDGEARAWELATGRLIRSIEAAEGALSPDGKTLFAVGSGVLCAVDLSTGRERRRVRTDSGLQQEQLVVSPDGKRLAFLCTRVGFNKGLRYRSHVIIYDAASLDERWRMEQDAWAAVDVAFSRDGRLMALAGSSGHHGVLEEPTTGSIRLYDLASRAEVRRIAIEGFGVASVAFVPDGRAIAAGVGDRTIRRFDIATGQERLPRLGEEQALPLRKPGEVLHKGYDKACAAGCLAFSPDGSLLASGVEGIGWFNNETAEVPPIRFWDWAAGREVRKLGGHPIGTISLAFTPDGKTLASSGFEPMARLWDVATGREVDRRPGHSTTIDGLAVSPIDGTVFTFSQADGPILHWDPADGRMLESMGVYRKQIGNMAISPDGRTLVLLPQGREPVLWDLAACKVLRNLGDEKHLGCCFVAFSPDGRLVTGQHRVWDVATGRRLAKFLDEGMSWCLSSFSADGRRVITVKLERIRIWDVATGAEVRRAVEKIPMARNAAISPDGRLVAVGQFRPADGLESREEPGVPGRQVEPIRIWELASGREVMALFGHQDISSGLAFSPDGRMLASVSGAWLNRLDPGLRIWDVASGKPLRRFKDEPGSGVRIAYLPDGRSIVTAGADGNALVWDVSDLADRRPPEPPDARALEALWSDLASDDAPRAHRASWALSVDGAVPFLCDRLRPAAANEPIAGREVLRSLRAIAALERIGSAQTREVLEGMVQGSPDAPAAQNAADALLRLSRRKPLLPSGAAAR